MRNHLIKAFLSIVLLVFCESTYANGFNITINVDGQEYYSDRNGYSEKALALKSGKKSAEKKHVNTVTTSAHYSVSKKKSKYTEMVAKAANKHQVDPKLVHAVIQAESAYNAKAESSAGAVGLMQLMPGTARRYGVTDRRDPYQSIDGGTHYLKDLLHLFNSDLNLAVAAYNAGENAVIRHHKSIPPYRETRNYVKRVLALKGRANDGISDSAFQEFNANDGEQDISNNGWTIDINYP